MTVAADSITAPLADCIANRGRDRRTVWATGHARRNRGRRAGRAFRFELPTTYPDIKTIAELGMLLLVFHAGLEMDFPSLRRAFRGKGLW
jgi:hypothetical protein